jgi:tetratricopeptide (TPR) repeat protein
MSKRLDMLQAMVDKGASDPFVHYALGMELRSLGRPDDALIAFSNVRARFPSYVPTYLMAGQVAIELGQVEAARELLTEGLAQARNVGDGHAESELSSALATLSRT